MASATLPPSRRLRRRGEFQRVFDNGRRAHGRYLTVIALAGENPEGRLGIVASKKLGGAVVRNRAKRLIRQVFRTQAPPAVAADLVVLPKPALLESTPADLARDFAHILRRLGVSTN